MAAVSLHRILFRTAASSIGCEHRVGHVHTMSARWLLSAFRSLDEADRFRYISVRIPVSSVLFRRR
ncbi:MAG: hypothetical protein OXH06_02410 [Gemmatimonadetes bacterium]|nr:hypothetical protein [Gemmatimonadota bacterium]MDE3258045.1 hypothetical protein [Gemmatimonadota bacterium]